MIDFLEVKIRDIDKLRKFCDDFIECKNLQEKRLVPWYFTPETNQISYSHNMFGSRQMIDQYQNFSIFL